MDYGFTKERTEELQRVFEKFCKPELGGIPFTTLPLALEAAGVRVSTQDLGLELKLLAKDARPGSPVVLSAEQFLLQVAEKTQRVAAQDNLLEAFRVFDVNGTGFVSTSNLIEVMLGEQNPHPPSREEIGQLIMEADVDHDGRIDYQEFIRMLFEI